MNRVLTIAGLTAALVVGIVAPAAAMPLYEDNSCVAGSLGAALAAEFPTTPSWPAKGGWSKRDFVSVGGPSNTGTSTPRPSVYQLSEPFLNNGAIDVRIRVTTPASGSNEQYSASFGYLAAAPIKAGQLEGTAACHVEGQTASFRDLSGAGGGVGNGTSTGDTATKVSFTDANIAYFPYPSATMRISKLWTPVFVFPTISGGKTWMDAQWTADGTRLGSNTYSTKTPEQLACRDYEGQVSGCLGHGPTPQELDPSEYCNDPPQGTPPFDFAWIPFTVNHYAKCLTVPLGGWDRNLELANILDNSAVSTVASAAADTADGWFISGSCGWIFRITEGWLAGVGVNSCGWSSWAEPVRALLGVMVAVMSGVYLVQISIRMVIGMFNKTITDPMADAAAGRSRE